MIIVELSPGIGAGLGRYGEEYCCRMRNLRLNTRKICSNSLLNVIGINPERVAASCLLTPPTR
jgi:hypothetical protein